MEKDFHKTKKKYQSGQGYMISLLIAVAFVAVIALSFSFLTRSVNDNIIRSNIESMEELALHDQNSIRNAVALRLDCMETISEKLKARKFADSNELFAFMVEMAQSIPSADVLCFLDSEGTAYDSDGIVTKNSYLADVCEGKADSFVIRLNTSGHLPELVRETLFEAVPVNLTVDGHQMEWLICQFPIRALENELKISSYEGKGFSSVIDRDGYYIINMSRTHNFLSRDNFFNDLAGAEFEGYGSFDEFRASAAVAAAGATSAVYSRDGQKYILIITAFDVTDWYFVSTVPVSVFEAQTRTIVHRFMLLLAIIAVILAAVILLVIRQRKERERVEEGERHREELERRKLIDGITSAYNVAYVVNMSDDTFENLRMDNDIIGYDESFGNFTQAKNYFIQLLLPIDRERMGDLLDYQTIRRKLAESKSFDAEYRLPINGAMIWHTMNVTAIDEDTVTIGFAVDDLGITKRHLEDMRFSDYFALYEIDLDSETAKIVIDSPYYPVDRAGTGVPYRAAMLSFAESLNGEAKELFTRMADLDYAKKALENDDKYTCTYRSDNVDGRWVDLTSFVTLRHADGTPAMFTLGFSYIDSFGASKQELQSQIASQKIELEESLTFTNYFLDAYISAYYIGLADRSCQVYKRTSSLEQRYPIRDDYMESLTQYINSAVHSEDREELLAFVRPERMRSMLMERSEYTHTFRDISDGTEKKYALHVIRGADADHAAFGFRDITEEMRLQQEQQEQLEQALKKAESSNRAKTEFLFNMSHDIRTPMNAINGFTTMAKKYIDDKKAVTDYLEKIDASGKQLLSLINNVLEMARIESGTIVLEERPVNIRRAFYATTTVLSEQARINGQEFICSLDDIRHFNVFADETKVSSITLNVLSNALKYTPEGGKITFRLYEVAGRKPGCASYTLTVTDTGIGMSREFMSTLFAPFAREKNSTVSGIQGTGLGMSIVKRFVDLMDGDIAVQSEPGKGTRFDITLDFRINEEAEPEDEKAEEILPVSFRGLKVLLVEDNELNREIALDILEEEGFETEEAKDGAAAVELLRKKGPDYYNFILMDIQMPVMNGYEATTAIREMYPGKHIPIIALSANAFEEDRKASKAAGMDDHVAKPINLNELFNALSKYIVTA